MEFVNKLKDDNDQFDPNTVVKFKLGNRWNMAP